MLPRGTLGLSSSFIRTEQDFERAVVAIKSFDNLHQRFPAPDELYILIDERFDWDQFDYQVNADSFSLRKRNGYSLLPRRRSEARTPASILATKQAHTPLPVTSGSRFRQWLGWIRKFDLSGILAPEAWGLTRKG